jgi:uncharacterized membrane protein
MDGFLFLKPSTILKKRELNLDKPVTFVLKLMTKFDKANITPMPGLMVRCGLSVYRVVSW